MCNGYETGAVPAWVYITVSAHGAPAAQGARSFVYQIPAVAKLFLSVRWMGSLLPGDISSECDFDVSCFEHSHVPVRSGLDRELDRYLRRARVGRHAPKCEPNPAATVRFGRDEFDVAVSPRERLLGGDAGVDPNPADVRVRLLPADRTR